MPDSDGPRLYDDLADWYHLLTTPSDYAEEAAFYTETIRSIAPDAQTVLELGCGGGCNASFMKDDFTMTLTDRSPAMLEVSRRINPDCEHAVGDMRSMRLGQVFDAVFVHDAVMYLTAEAQLRDAIATAAAHARPDGGLVMFAPDWVLEAFRELTTRGGHDGEGRSLRYLEWIWAPSSAAVGRHLAYYADFAYMLREGDAPVRVVHDRHEFCAFARDLWLDAMRDADLTSVRSILAQFAADGFAPEVFVGIRDGAAE